MGMTGLIGFLQNGSAQGIIVSCGFAGYLILKGLGPALEGGASFVRALKEKNKNR